MSTQRVESRSVRREGGEPARPLADVAAAVKRDEATVAELFETFMRARLYLPRPPRPGVHHLDIEGRRVVPVFSSELELARFAGRIEWFSTLGFDLLDLLPAGVVLGLDIASPHRLQLHPADVHLERDEARRWSR
jgi:hypothetical protein